MCTHEASTLLLSPVQAMVLPRTEPLRSWKVWTSASTWQGCDFLVSPLMTGTSA